MAIRTSIEGPRGCGFRKVGGLYLVSGNVGVPCRKLPIPLEVCPVCGAGFKPARGWTWVDGDKIVAMKEYDCEKLCIYYDKGCIISPIHEIGRAGLIWVGTKFYSTTQAFLDEASAMGVSRRIPGIPRGFELGETVVFLAHRFAIDGERPGIFQVFRPERIEKIVSGDESKEEIEKMEARGITPVKVIPVQGELPLDPDVNSYIQ